MYKVRMVEEKKGLFKPIGNYTEVPSTEVMAALATVVEVRMGLEFKAIKRKSEDELIMIFQGKGA